MAWVLDVFVVLIVLFYMFICARRGFVRTMVEVVGFFLAFSLSFAVGGLAANAVYDHIVCPSIVEKTVESVGDQVQGNADLTTQQVWAALPKTVTVAAENFGITAQSVSGAVHDQIQAGGSVQQIVQRSVETVARPIIVPLIKTIIGTVLLFIFMFAVKLLAKTVGRVFRLPILRQVDSILGIVLGLIKGLLIAAILCIIISTVVGLTPNGFWCFTKENIEASAIFRLLARLSPFYIG